MRRIFLLIAVISLLTSVTTTAQELVQNGSFTNGAAGWTADCADVEAYYAETTYGGSLATNKVAEVDDGSCFHQDICVLPGASYILSLRASRRSIAAATVSTTVTVQGLDAANTAVGTALANTTFSRNNTAFSFTPVTGIPVISVPAGSGIVRLRIKFTDATPGTSTLGMIVDDISLTFQAPPAYNGDTQTCVNTATQLGISNLPATGIYYNWQITGGTPPTATSANPVASWANTGTYAIYCVLSNGICPVDTVRRNIEVVTISAPTVVSPVSYCQGQPAVPLSATGATLKWYTTATGGTASLTAPTPGTDTAGTTTWYVSNASGICESERVPVVVHVNRAYARFTPGKYNICIGDPVTINNQDSGSTALSYFWDFGDNTTTSNQQSPTHTYAAPGTYTITHIATDLQPCSDTLRVQVNVLPKPVVDAGKDTTILYGNTVQLYGTMPTGKYFLWDPAGTLNNANIPNPVATPLVTTRYTLVAIDTNDCRNTDSVKITVSTDLPVIIPSAFTPNGDGHNDVFRVSNLRFQKLLEFRVFNRLGQEVFATTDGAQGWNGTYRGAGQETGVYYYIVRIAWPDGRSQTFKGDVTLVR